MTKRMLIDATHAEETRVVVLEGNRLEDFDVETSTKRQLKGNIYLAKVVRVEPSLQAAFVEYGGNRHGFLAFGEIHPDYYQIPVADRQRLIEMEAEEARREEEEADLELALDQAAGTSEPAGERTGSEAAPTEALANAQHAPFSDAEPTFEPGRQGGGALPLVIEPETLSGPLEQVQEPGEPATGWTEEAAHAAPPAAELGASATETAPASDLLAGLGEDSAQDGAASRAASWAEDAAQESQPAAPEHDAGTDDAGAGHDAPLHHDAAYPVEAEPVFAHWGNAEGEGARPDELSAADGSGGEDQRDYAGNGFTADGAHHGDDLDTADTIPESPPPETVGGDHDSADESRERRIPPRFLRNYKIQEVIRRRQILLVQVVKEERGTKGAALTTYLSLAGRFGVLMPNSPRGGGISRKITSPTDRRRLKEVMAELDIPRGMGLIVRTAGANRPKPEIKRDCEYLLRLWDDIRDTTMKSVAPALIYEEASLIKRAIRDVYSRDVDEILVDGEEGWRAAHDFMRMLMPTHAKKVQLWRDGGQPLFARNQVEAQLDAMLLPIVQLRSGGYLVINQAEALVAIDVNSGRSTRERNIEETALRTNLEAADEVARQLRLRDLAGLIVIDFIDMESKRHNAMVERRLKEALKNDRARIQVGHISHFGLLEMSRQRLRPSLAETSFIPCPHCGGTGHVRSTESAAIHVLRGIEDEGSKRRAAEIVVHVSTPIALYLLNHKRERIREIELRYTMRVMIAADDHQIAPQYRIEKVRAQIAGEALPVVTPDSPAVVLPAPVAEPAEEETESARSDEDEIQDEGQDEVGGEDAGADAAAGSGEDGDRQRKRRRRRRRGRRDDAAQATPASGDDGGAEAPAEDSEDTTGEETAAAQEHIEGVPEHAEPELDEEARNRRRGRRGGRRRRREDDGSLSPLGLPGAEQPDLIPAYAGPTPADPFGGHAFDIFDVLEQAERRSETPRAVARAPELDSAIVNRAAPEPLPSEEHAVRAESAPAEDSAAVPVADDAAAEPSPAAVAPAAAEPQASPAPIENAMAPEPASAEPVVVESEPPVPANDVVAGPAVKPIVIGSEEEPPTERKRGWWRR